MDQNKRPLFIANLNNWTIEGLTEEQFTSDEYRWKIRDCVMILLDLSIISSSAISSKKWLQEQFDLKKKELLKQESSAVKIKEDLSPAEKACFGFFSHQMKKESIDSQDLIKLKETYIWDVMLELIRAFNRWQKLDQITSIYFELWELIHNFWETVSSSNLIWLYDELILIFQKK